MSSASLPTLRAFLGALGLTKTTTTSTARGLASLQGAPGLDPLTKTDTDVRDVVNALVTAVEGPELQAVVGLGVEGSAVADVDARYGLDSSSADAFVVLPTTPTLGRRITVYVVDASNACTVKANAGNISGGTAIGMSGGQSVTLVCINATGPVWAVESGFANGSALVIA